MSEAFEGEWVGARYVERRPGHFGHIRWREKVVRCRDDVYKRQARNTPVVLFDKATYRLF